eukprot:132077-Rhodomonas_salina.1
MKDQRKLPRHATCRSIAGSARSPPLPSTIPRSSCTHSPPCVFASLRSIMQHRLSQSDNHHWRGKPCQQQCLSRADFLHHLHKTLHPRSQAAPPQTR